MKIKKFINKIRGSNSKPLSNKDVTESERHGSEVETGREVDTTPPSSSILVEIEGCPIPPRTPSSPEHNGKTKVNSAVDTARTGHRPSVARPLHSISTQQSSRSISTHTQQSSRCPFRHGTVYTNPYPGYIHGNPKRGICPNGCRPEMNTNVTEVEDPSDTLLREATEFIELYYHERQDEMKGTNGFLSKEERMDAVKRSIEETGTYVHTFDELQHGSRVAWRNAPKCSNRKYWQQLKLLDARGVTTNKGMFDSCIQHLAKAMSCGSSEAYITVFKPAPPEKSVDGPRIWNDQLLQYAAYNVDGEVCGDPKNLRFTEMLNERFGWDGPADGKRGPWDYLPLVIQANPKEAPELFEVPVEMCPPVHIHHPRYPELSSLGMRWYPIPAVCALDLTVGGIVYTAAPFSGWYASTEVLRDLTDEGRYNMLVPVAKTLGMDPSMKPGEAPFWKDEVMNILSMAVYHSYKTAKVAMIDHHTLIDMFWAWYGNEMLTRKYCPVNFKWVIPPMSSTTNQAYLGLSKAQEYTLKPAYVFGRSPFHLETKYFGRRDTSIAVSKLIHSVYLAILFKRCIGRMRERKQPLLIVYASVTGNSARYASDLGSILRSCCNVTFFDACGTTGQGPADILPLIESSTLTVFVSSTQGNGELPSLSQKLFTFLFDKNGSCLSGKKVAVLGFGSSAYPVFCGAAMHLSKKLTENRAIEVIPRGECDSVKGEAITFNAWTTKLVKSMASMPFASPLVLALADDIKESTASSLATKHSMMDFVNIEVFSAEEVQTAAAQSYLTRRQGSMGRIISRRSTIESTDSSTRSPFQTLDSSSHSHSTPMVSNRLMSLVGRSSLRYQGSDKIYFEGRVKSRDDLISNSSTSEGVSGAGNNVKRTTSLVKIDLESCGNLPYEPGDHIRVFPRSVVRSFELESYVEHLKCDEEAGKLSLDDHIYISLKDAEIPRSELAVSMPLLHKSMHNLIPLEYIFENLIALEAPISMQACIDLSRLATGAKDRAILSGVGHSKKEYERMISLCGMKWIDLFTTFPSLSKQVNLKFLLCNCKMNHPRSYSIASCKSVVGSELHMVVGRYLYSRGGSKIEAGVCSSFLTAVEPGDDILFTIESDPSFHHPLDPTCPIIFVCTGTGIAPIRGLIQKRSHLKSRGEKLGPAYLIFGSRSSKEKLFHDEIWEFQTQGVLTKVFMCYSREMGERKEYTTDKIRSKEVSKVLGPVLAEPNTHIFICGSANMAEDCKNALRDISSGCCFDTLTEEGRLHCDVFGALNPRKQNIFNRRITFDSLEDMEEQLTELKVVSESDHVVKNRHHRPTVHRSSSCNMMGKNSKASAIDPLKKKKKR